MRIEDFEKTDSWVIKSGGRGKKERMVEDCKTYRALGMEVKI